MLTACHKTLTRAYDRIGAGDDAGASTLADGLAACGGRASCPYAGACGRRLAALRDDIRLVAAGDGLAVSTALLGAD